MAPKSIKGVVKDPFRWNEGLMKIFIKLCLKWQKENGTEQQFSWVDIALQFNSKVGKECDRDTMKNKFAYMKRQWKDWKDLKHGETGLGWDAATGKITAEPEWWDKKIKENADFKRFRKKGIPQETESMWDELFGSIVASGQHCVAPSMATRESIEPNVEGEENENDSNSDDEFDNLYNIDLERSDPEVLQDILKEVGASAAKATSKGVKRTTVEKSQSLGQVKTRKRQSVGSALYNQHIAMVGETSQKMLALYENDVCSSVVAASSCKHTLTEAMGVVEDMINENLLIEGTPLWCFSIEELKKEDSRELFLAIPRNSGRKAWFEWQFQKQK